MLGVQSPIPAAEMPNLYGAPPAAAPNYGQAAPGYAPLPNPAPAQARASRAPVAPQKGIRLVPFLLGLGGLVAVLGIGAALLMKKPSALDVTLGAKPTGAETLVFTCATCEDGTVASVSGSEGKFAGGKLELETKEPLKIGENRLEIHLKRPKGREEILNANVPVLMIVIWRPLLPPVRPVML